MTHELTLKEHKERHLKLHQALDELLADFIDHTGKYLSNTSIMELLEWSHTQWQNPSTKQKG
jgi:hypothetical protein